MKRFHKYTLPLRIDGAPTQREVVKVSSWGQRLLWWLRMLVVGLKKDGSGLWMTPCKSVMALPGEVDLVFLRSDGTVVKVVPHLSAWHSAACRRAGSVLALPAGVAKRLGLRPGIALDLMV